MYLYFSSIPVILAIQYNRQYKHLWVHWLKTWLLNIYWNIFVSLAEAKIFRLHRIRKKKLIWRNCKSNLKQESQAVPLLKEHIGQQK